MLYSRDQYIPPMGTLNSVQKGPRSRYLIGRTWTLWEHRYVSYQRLRYIEIFRHFSSIWTLFDPFGQAQFVLFGSREKKIRAPQDALTTPVDLGQ